MNEHTRLSHSLIVIARITSGDIVTRMLSHRPLFGAMNTARSVLRLKPEVGVEVHRKEHPTSQYQEKPLAVVSLDDRPAPSHPPPCL